MTTAARDSKGMREGEIKLRIKRRIDRFNITADTEHIKEKMASFFMFYLLFFYSIEPILHSLFRLYLRVECNIIRLESTSIIPTTNLGNRYTDVTVRYE